MLAPRGRQLDGYVFRQTVGTLGVVIGVVMSLMVLENFPRLIDITRLSGHRGYIVAQMVAGLLPEYIGIGLLTGLYLAIALTVRRLTMRGEVDAIEACGVSPWRWMRMPMLLAAVIAVLTLINQGWLMPMGERRLDDVGRRMALGEYGYNLTAGQFVELGKGNVMTFQHVNSGTGRLTGLFLKSGDRTFTAASGRLAMSREGDVLIDLYDGLALGERDRSVFGFAKLRFHTEAPGIRVGTGKNVDPLRLEKLDALVASPHRGERAVAWGRSLWAALVLFLPVLAYVLGKPPRRESGAFGIILGMAVLVLYLKVFAGLTDGQVSRPGIMSMAIVASWVAAAFGLIRAERALGQGFVDRWAMTLVGRATRWLSNRSCSAPIRRSLPVRAVSDAAGLTFRSRFGSECADEQPSRPALSRAAG